MTDSMPPAEVANSERFERLGLDAEAGAVAQAREDFAQWLKRFFAVDAVRFSDLVLAINEALANAAEFAYLLSERPGTIDMQAAYHPAEQKLTVEVCDRGRWRTPQSDPPPRTRGRGIPLMEALADEAAINTSAHGTRVQLSWRDIAAS